MAATPFGQDVLADATKCTGLETVEPPNGDLA
jgi:hypothetical protein